MILLFGATGLLLLIACGNIATLSLGELQGRDFELMTRAAFGARKHKIACQLLTESLLLGALGSLLGAVVAVGGTNILAATAPPISRVSTFGVDIRVFAFAALLETIAGLMFGTVPALVSVKNSITANMGGSDRTGTAQRGRLERVVITSEIALTVVLLIAGGLLARSLSELLTVDPGFRPRGLATVHIALPSGEYGTSQTTIVSYHQSQDHLNWDGLVLGLLPKHWSSRALVLR